MHVEGCTLLLVPTSPSLQLNLPQNCDIFSSNVTKKQDLSSLVNKIDWRQIWRINAQFSMRHKDMSEQTLTSESDAKKQKISTFYTRKATTLTVFLSHTSDAELVKRRAHKDATQESAEGM